MVEYLAIAAVAVSSSPFKCFDALVDESSADLRLGLQLGQLEAGVLEIDDRLAERLALLHVVDRVPIAASIAATAGMAIAAAPAAAAPSAG